MDYNRVLDALRAVAADASIRGDGPGRFVFAKLRDRAVEISEYEKGVWVEYWSDDGGDAPTFDRTFSDAGAAVADAARWLADSADAITN